ncbi:hypothetical protein [Serratia ureilytica]|uniref:hypothetical protein n=1 Tax=Serratia ureilytica TaxID=300181 RepID=UPI0019D09C9F|nr:hypothetical protein [Serratia ureilytica]MBN5247001.1 hypothetical protein [Serratia ureilytica]
MARRKRIVARTSLPLILALIVITTYVDAASTAQTEIKGRIIASCTVKVPPIVKLGPMNRRDIVQGSDRGVRLYATAFTVTTICVAGTDKYRLNVKSDRVTSSGCAEADSGAMAFCLYHDGEQMTLNGADGGSIIGTTRHAEETLTVMPARGSKAAVAGEHSASVTVTVEPQ